MTHNLKVVHLKTLRVKSSIVNSLAQCISKDKKKGKGQTLEDLQKEQKDHRVFNGLSESYLQ